MTVNKRELWLSGGTALLVVMVVLIALHMDVLLQAAVLAVLLGLLVAGLKNPILPLFVYVALIPLEDAFQLSDFGTINKVVGIVFVSCYLVRSVRNLRLGVVRWSGWAWFLWAALSIAWALSPDLALARVLLLGQQLLMVLVIANVLSKNQNLVEPLLGVYAAAAVLAAGLAVAGYYIGQASSSGLSRIEAFEDQSPAHFAASLVPAVMLGLFYLTRARSWLLRALSATLLVLTALAVLMSGTRSAWVGLLVGSIFMFDWRSRGRGLVIIVLFVAGIVVYTAQIPFLRDFILDRSSNAIDSGGAGRMDIWKVGLTIAEDHPIVGVGFGNFPQAFTFDAIARTRGLGNYSGLYAGRAAHNIFLGSLVETGLVGLTFLSSFMWSIARRVQAGPLNSLIQAIVVAYLVQGSFLDITNRKYFWFVVALAASMHHADRTAERHSRLEESA